ncbi:hypothetical protein J6590_097591 [Homalodisca vitripennis]|nr:hypothetical protein J6590_097591 [Homalodisca vitripennis]
MLGRQPDYSEATEPPRAKLGCRSLYDVNNLLLLQTEPPRAKLGCRSLYDVNNLLVLQTELPSSNCIVLFSDAWTVEKSVLGCGARGVGYL